MKTGQVNLPEDLAAKLRSYQLQAVGQLALALRTYAHALDGSDTGIGKTYHALGVACDLFTNFGVICPAAAISKWRALVNEFDLDNACEFIISWDCARSGRFGPFKRAGKTFLTPKFGPGLFILDEAHYASGQGTWSAELLHQLVESDFRVLMLSATAADNPLDLKAIGYALGLHHWSDFWTWCLKMGAVKSYFGQGRGLQWPKKSTPKTIAGLKSIHEHIFPTRGVRIRRGDPGVDLPKVEVCTELVDLPVKPTPLLEGFLKEIQDRVEQDYAEAVAKEREVSPLTKSLREAMRVELLKAPWMAERARANAKRGIHTPIFVQFDVTRRYLIKDLDCLSIYGGFQYRDATLSAFQENKLPYIILQVQAGGIAIDLHDVLGGHPREALVCPIYDVKLFIQVLGRVHRQGAKSPGWNVVAFAAKTCEERTCRRVQRKCDDVAALNDGDLSDLRFYGEAEDVKGPKVK